LQCEVCGSKIHGKSYTVIIEGAKLTVCTECSKHGKIIIEEAKPKTPILKPRIMLPHPKAPSKTPSRATIETAQELVENFDSKIRQAREKLGISHEELGKKINEKVSLLRKLETGKMKPDNVLAVKLEHALKIKLIAPASEEKIPQAKIPRPISREVTLGDLIQLNKKGKEKEEPAERKQS
jgi:putative transcription factor